MIPTLLALVACTPEPLRIEASVVDGGVQVQASRAMASVELRDGGGAAVGRATLAIPSEQATVLAPIRPGARLTVVASAADGVEATATTTAPTGCAHVEIEIPAGQARWPATAGAWPVPVGDGRTTVAVRLTALAPCRPQVHIDGAPITLDLPTAGAREVLYPRVADRPVRVHIDELDLELVPEAVDPAKLRDQLAVTEWAFPATARGAVDPTLAPDRIDLPPRWWEVARARAGLGVRPRDDQAPWAWQSVSIANASDVPLHVVVSASILDHGAPSAAFRVRLRSHAVDEARALLTVPANGTATAALPVFVDGFALDGRIQVTRRLAITPLGTRTPIHTLDAPLTVSRGSSVATAGLLAAIGVSLLGWLGMALGFRRWIANTPTTDLVTVALFASATWVVGAAFQVIGTAVGWLLGPFTPFVMGLPDQAFRACLLATLLTLLPRPGVLALATTLGFLLRGLTFGALHPTDLLYLGSAVVFLESGAWMSGLTRGGAWRDAGRTVRWLRLVLGLGSANVAATAAGLVISATLYRLYLAEWYVIGLLALPGLAYVAVGCALAVPFAEGLREVRR
ncbi:MAG: hypothetical protein ACI8PZ_002591 [Myxococcota bacterium]